MKSPQSTPNAGRRGPGKVRRIVSLSAATAIVIGVGAGSAVFMDYLADRAQARSTADGPVHVKPVVAEAAVPAPAPPVSPAEPAQAKAEPIKAEPVKPAKPVMPAQERIEATTPDAAAIAKVAANVGPEHAIELPTDDPTANPVVQLDDPVEAVEEVEVAALAPQPLALQEDETQTAAISPVIVVPKEATPPRKAAKAATVKAKPAAPPTTETPQTEVASLPGVEMGGIAGNPSAEAADSTVRTVTKPVAAGASRANRGGPPPGNARVTTAVNMRSGPQSGSRVLSIVPTGATVNVVSCDGWCQIAYNGRTGWVYKSFLSAGQPQQKVAAAPKQKAAQPQQKAAAAPKTAATPAQDEAEAAVPPGRKIPSSRL